MNRLDLWREEHYFAPLGNAPFLTRIGCKVREYEEEILVLR